METVCNPSTTKRIVLRAARAKRPIFIWGPPGIGKSDTVADIAHSGLSGNNYLIDLRLALMEPTDLRGFPWRNPETNSMEWAPPADLPSQEFAEQYDNIVLFLDELNSAPPSVQAAAYQLILNRRIGQYNLPDNVIIVAAGNRENDRGVTYRMPAPLADRFRHVYMGVNFQDWMTWALNNNVSAEVVGFLKYDESKLFTFDPKSPTMIFATPRSWTYVSEILEDPDFDKAGHAEKTAEVAGAVGEGTANDFMSFRKLAGKLPDPQDVLDGTVKTLNDDIKKELGALYSLTITMTYKIHQQYKEFLNNQDSKAAYKTSFNNACRFSMENMEPEMVILMLKTLMKDYGVQFDIRHDFDDDIRKTFNDRYVKYLVEEINN